MVTHQTPNVSQAGFDIKTFSRGASDSASFNFISLNPVSVQNDDWFINKAHPLMKVSSNIKLFSSNIETQMDLLVDNGASNSLLKFSSLPTHFKNVIQTFCTNLDHNQDLKKHSVGIKTCNGDSFAECVVARVWLSIGQWSGEHQFIITDNITNQEGISGRDFLLQYNTVIDNSNNILRINNKNTNASITTNSCEVSNTVKTYFIQSNSTSKSCYLSSKTKVPKDSESLLEVKFDDLNEFNSEKDVLFEPVKMKSLFLAHSVSKIEDGKMYVSAINVSGKDVEMDSGQKVGSINEVANVEVESVEAEVRKREAEVC